MLSINSPLIKIVALLAVFMFCGGYWICSALYEICSKEWWDLRFVLITIGFLAAFTAGYLLSKNFTKAVFLVGIVFCMGDLSDRFFFSITDFNINDCLLYLFALLYLPTQYVREIKGTTR